MPNWNSNNLIVKGKTEDVLLFIKENFKTNENPYKEGEFSYILDFETILPTPIDSEGEIINDWYEWRCANWGCKWTPSFEQCITLTLYKITDDDKEEAISYKDSPRKDKCNFDENNILDMYSKLNELEYQKAELNVFFETPWCPPEAIIEFWCNRYNENSIELNCKYYEPGMAFAGELGFTEDGEIIEISHNSSHLSEIDYIEYLLNEGWEDIELYVEDIESMLADMHSDMDKVTFNALVDKIKETLENAPDNKSRALLITDIHEKWRNFEK